MDLYLMQHGQATTETEDPERPLTDAGRAAVQRVAHWCTVCRSVVSEVVACTMFVAVISDGSLMHPRCRRVTAFVARHAMSTLSIAGLGGSRGVVTVDRAERRNLNAEQ
jgi:hypothetical protein